MLGPCSELGTALLGVIFHQLFIATRVFIVDTALSNCVALGTTYESITWNTCTMNSSTTWFF